MHTISAVGMLRYDRIVNHIPLQCSDERTATAVIQTPIFSHPLTRHDLFKLRPEKAV